MDKKLRVGIIGGAFAGTLHAEGWMATNRAEIIGMASPSQATRDAFVSKFGGKAYEDGKTLLENEDLDVVSLTLPNIFTKN